MSAAKSNKPKRVAQYIRVSTLEQAKEGNSLKGQQDSLSYFIKAHKNEKNWITNKSLLYIDDGYSGANDQRPEYQRMMQDARDGKFDVILVYKIDRLFRKTKLLLDAVEELEKNNIEFCSQGEAIDTTKKEGRFFLTVLGAIAEMERETIRDRTIMGKIAGARKGRYVGGKYPPYGYDVDKNGKMVINKEEAKIVKEIFHMLVKEKKSETEIAKILTARKVLTKADKKKVKRRTNAKGFWGQAAIAALIIKDEYSGTYYYGKRETIVDENTKSKKRQILRPRGEWIPLKCPAIIKDKKLFQAAQKIAKANRRYSLGDDQHQYLLRSNVHCGECGGRYQGYPKRKDGKIHYQYRCSRGNASKTDKPCTNTDISEKKLEARVWEPIEKLLNNPKQYLAALERKLKQESRLPEYEEQLADTNKKLKGKEIERKRLNKAMKTGAMSYQDYDEEITETREAEVLLESEVRRLTALIDGEKEKEQMLNSIEKLAKTYQKKYKSMNKETKERIVRLLIHRVVIYPNRPPLVEHRIPKLEEEDDSDNSDNQLSNHGGDAGS
ncbi:recombinase family protein [Candidatus Peribacteria bacterium]|nr:recombinase family protein [Candidatus Peribacteria bacterium]